MTKTTTALFLVLLVVGLVFLQSFHLQAQGQAVTPLVRIEPVQEGNLNPGENFTIYVWVDNASNVEAAQVQFTYDRTVLNASELAEGPFLPSVGLTIIGQLYAAPVAGSDTLGEVYYASAGTSYKTASGSGILLNATFTVLTQGSQQFHLLTYTPSTTTGTVLSDINMNNEIPTLQDGFYGSPVSLRVSQTILDVGSVLTLSGEVSGSSAGNVSSVGLQYEPLGGNWTDLATLQTDSSGQFSYQWTPTENGAFEFQISFIYNNRTSNSASVEVIVQPQLRGYGIEVLYAFVGLLVVVTAASIILHVRTSRKKAAEKPPI